MLFTEYGKKGSPAVLLMHGMLQDWHSMYELLGSLENDYRLIIPAMDGMYEGCGIFTSFADQCRQIEEYVKENHGGELLGVYGISQGATLMAELLARNNITVHHAVLDGLYTAHQGKQSAEKVMSMFAKAKENGGKFPPAMMVMMKLMGLSKEDSKMFDCTYWDVDMVSMKRNLLENYTYHLNSAISENKTEVILLRGEKEPYAKKSNEMFRAYRPECREVVFKDLGHGQLIYGHSAALCDRIRAVFSSGADSYIMAAKKTNALHTFGDLSKYDYIYEGLEKIYGKNDMVQIAETAKRYYGKFAVLTADAPKGEKKHLNDTILIAASFYKSLLKFDRENALENIRNAMMGMCADLGKLLDGALHVPGSQGMFMKIVPKIVRKSFGSECGFEYRNFTATSDKVSFDMVKCPYVKYAEMLGCPELTPVFCDCDNATYGSLNGISFERTQTLGSGGEMCDFVFRRKAEK